MTAPQDASAPRTIPLVPRRSRLAGLAVFGIIVVVLGVLVFSAPPGVISAEANWRNLDMVGVIFAVFGLVVAYQMATLVASRFRSDRLVLTDEGLVAHLKGHRHEASWAQIADVVMMDLIAQTPTGVPRLVVRLRTPSGAPVEWFHVLDIHQVDIFAMERELLRWLERAPRRDEPVDSALAERLIGRRDRRVIWLAAAAIGAPLVLGVIWLVGWRQVTAP